MNTADLIWLNGEFVAWEDAKVHVLTHALHYGTGVFEGIRAYETDRGTGDLPQPGPPGPAREVGQALLHGPALHEGAAPRGHARADRPQRLQELLHPAARLARLRPDGPQPARQPGRGDDRGVGVGRLPRRGGQAERRARPRVVLPPHLVRVADPALEGLRPVPQLRAREDRVDQGRLRGGDPARRQRLRLRGHRRERLRDQGRRDLHAAARPTGILDGINRKSCIQIARDLGYEVVERDIARAELALADEVFLTGTAAELTPLREIDDIEIGAARARSRARSRASSTTRCTAATPATRTGSTSCRCRRRRERRVPSECPGGLGA